MLVNEFADGEFQVSYEESVRGDEIYLVQSMFPPTDNLMELLLMIDAAKRASAKSVTAVIPYFGWARQDRKDRPRVSIGAKLVAGMLTTAGVDSIITMDLHADQIQGFFNIPLNHLYASSVFVPYINSLKLKDMVFASPDVGGAKRVLEYAKHYKVPMALCHKQRARANVVEKMTIIGDVKDKNVILVDDMIDTAGTICTAAEVMMKNGAKSVRAIASHGVMSDPATERINKSPLTEVVISDSINYDTSRSDKVKRVSVAGLIAETIQRINDHESISSQYIINH
jgi:ribose-phosphate pyrophosphokinase